MVFSSVLILGFTTCWAAPVPNPTMSPWLEAAPFQDTDTEWRSERQVVVIGAGISGSSVAYHLATEHRETDIALLDARGVSGGASGRNSGGLDTSVDWQSVVEVHGIARAKQLLHFELGRLADLQKQILELCGPQCELEFQPRYNGSIQIYMSQDSFDQDRAETETEMKTLPELDQSVLSGQECGRQLNTTPGVAGCISSLASASAICGKFVFSLTKEFLARGGGLHTRTEVTSIEPVRDEAARRQGWKWHVSTTSASSGFRTVRAKSVVIATNAYTGGLLPSWAARITPVRAQMIASAPMRWAHLPANIGFDEGDTYGHQRPSGEMVFGGFRRLGPGEQVGIADDSQIDSTISAALRSYLPKRFEGMKHATPTFNVTHEWTGIMGWSADGTPWIGPLRGPWRAWSGSGTALVKAEDDATGVFVIAGFSGGGFKRGFEFGGAVAHMVTHDGAVPEWWREFSWYFDTHLPTLNRTVSSWLGMDMVWV